LPRILFSNYYHLTSCIHPANIHVQVNAIGETFFGQSQNYLDAEEWKDALLDNIELFLAHVHIGRFLNHFSISFCASIPAHPDI
jgi:hypothetical protein